MSTGISLGEGRCTFDSGKALLIEFTEKEYDPMWIPQSCVHADSEVYEIGHTGNVVVELWWAREHRLS